MHPDESPNGAASPSASAPVPTASDAEWQRIFESLEDPAGESRAAELEGPPPATPHDPEDTRELLMRALGGEKKLAALMEETPPGLRPGQRREWLARVTPERAEVLILQARASGDHPWSGLTRLLDGEVNPRLRPAQPAEPGGNAYLSPQQQARGLVTFPPVGEGETWHSRTSGRAYRIEEVTSRSVFVAQAGEFPLQMFHSMFSADAPRTATRLRPGA